MVKVYSAENLKDFQAEFTESDLRNITAFSLEKIVDSKMWSAEKPNCQIFYYTKDFILSGNPYNVAVDVNAYCQEVPASLLPDAKKILSCEVRILHLIVTDETMPDEIMDAYNRIKKHGAERQEKGEARAFTIDKDENYHEII